MWSMLNCPHKSLFPSLSSSAQIPFCQTILYFMFNDIVSALYIAQSGAGAGIAGADGVWGVGVYKSDSEIYINSVNLCVFGDTVVNVYVFGT